MLEENGSNLSGGQKQRLAIARALMNDPRILVFDEATSNLDPESEAAIQANLAEIAKGRTTIIVAHRLSTLRRADEILVLDKGRVREMGRHEDLVEGATLYGALWRAQQGEAA
jgi:ATP-binding cassette subfamily B protein